MNQSREAYVEEAPVKRHVLLRRIVPRALHPLLRGIRRRLSRPRDLAEPYYSVFPYTQTHLIRQECMVRLATEVENRKVPGAIVECGVLDGGAAALMADATSRSGRPVHLFDSWEGLPEATERDGQAGLAWSNEIVGSPRRVRSVMARLKVDPSRLHFHKGWFNDTFPKVNIKQIALLHVDPDFYEPVRLCLETWAPRVSPGGFIQIDDYAAFVGCRTAVDEYLAKNPSLKLETVGDHTKAYFIRVPG